MKRLDSQAAAPDQIRIGARAPGGKISGSSRHTPNNTRARNVGDGIRVRNTIKRAHPMRRARSRKATGARRLIGCSSAMETSLKRYGR